MWRSLCRALTIVALAAGSASAQSTELGTIEFSTSGSPTAKPHFLAGVKYLHSFEFDDAAEAFREAQKLDPDFAMAYWGEAMSYNHPLWAEQDLGAARKTLGRLGATRAERLAKASTQREKDYLEALEVLYGEGDKLARDIAYAEAMRQLKERYPADREAAAFYALSLLGTVRPGDEGYRRQMLAAATAQEIFRANPNHPGAAHYLIHAFDDPEHAPIGLPAADAYAKIAPAAGHALHMPSHIYVQLGMWDRVAASNTAAHAASKAWAKRKGLPRAREDFHSYSWLHYARLQQGQFDKAKQALEYVRSVAAESDAPRVKSSLADMTARYAIEAQDWAMVELPAQAEEKPAQAAPRSPGQLMRTYDATSSTLLVAGMSAVRTGDLATAAKAETGLRAKREQAEASGRAYSAKPVAIMEKEVGALARLAEGKPDEAVRLLKEAVAIELSMDPPSGPPDPIKPAPELFGEVLLELDRPKEAMEQFETTLLRMPNRALSRLGAARAAAKLGDKTTALRHYGALVKLWAEAQDTPRVREARQFVGESSQH